METNFTGNRLLLTALSYVKFIKAEETFFMWLEEVHALGCCWEEKKQYHHHHNKWVSTLRNTTVLLKNKKI